MWDRTIRFGRSSTTYVRSILPSSASPCGSRNGRRDGTAALRPSRPVEALSLRLHQSGQIVAPAGAGSEPQSGTDLALEELEAGLSDDRQLPQGELGSAEGSESQLRAAVASLALSGAVLWRSTARSSMAMPARRQFTRKRLAEQITKLDLESRLTASLLRTMMRWRPRIRPGIALTVRAMAAVETAALSAPRSRR